MSPDKPNFQYYSALGSVIAMCTSMLSN